MSGHGFILTLRPLHTNTATEKLHRSTADMLIDGLQGYQGFMCFLEELLKKC